MLKGSTLSRPVDRPRQPPRRLGVRRLRSADRPGRADERGQGAGRALRQGWRPARTIVYASWDGEEPGLLGSTEWAEAHAAELKRKALIYINTDNNGRGFLRAAGSHELQHFVNQAAADVPDPAHRRTGGAARPRRDPRRRHSTSDARSTPSVIEAAQGRRRPAARRARLGLRLHRLPAASRHRLARRRLRRRGRIGRQLPLDLRQLSITSPISTIRAWSMARPCRRSSGGWCCAPPTPRASRRATATSPTPSSRYLDRGQEARRRPAREGPHARRPSPRGRLHARRSPQRPDRRARATRASRR